VFDLCVSRSSAALAARVILASAVQLADVSEIFSLPS
jgi:hypothetical protein